MINVGGVRYETYKSTLKNIPDTRLSWLTETTTNNPDFDPETEEYFFDRHPGVFCMILNYYRTGSLHVPTDVCGPLFEDELNFWGLDEKQIESCCWSNYRSHREAQKTVAELDNLGVEDDIEEDQVSDIFGITEDAAQRNCWEKWKPKIWRIMEYPNSSIAAKIMEGVSVFFVIISIMSFTLESVEDFRTPLLNNKTLTIRQKTIRSEPIRLFVVLEDTCITYFSLELLLRLLFCPNLRHFFQEPINWIDLLSLIPFYMRLILRVFHENSGDARFYVNMLRLVRIFRILRLTRHVTGIRILALTVRASAKELLLLILVVFMGITIFASLVYYAQQIGETSDNEFYNIPIGFWWALVTITTLGYGKIVPSTLLGRVVGGVCSLCGVLMLALPVPIIVNNFTLYYSHAQAKLKLPKKCKKVLVGAADALKDLHSIEDDRESALMSSEKRRISSMINSSSVSLTGKNSDDSAIGSSDSSTNPQSNQEMGISVVYIDEVGADANTTQPEKRISKISLGKRNSIHPLPTEQTPQQDHNSRRLSHRANLMSRRTSLFPKHSP